MQDSIFWQMNHQIYCIVLQECNVKHMIFYNYNRSIWNEIFISCHMIGFHTCCNNYVITQMKHLYWSWLLSSALWTSLACFPNCHVASFTLEWVVPNTFLLVRNWVSIWYSYLACNMSPMTYTMPICPTLNKLPLFWTFYLNYE